MVLQDIKTSKVEGFGKGNFMPDHTKGGGNSPIYFIYAQYLDIVQILGSACQDREKGVCSKFCCPLQLL